MESLSQSRIKALRKQVLQDSIQLICDDLGDPERYFPALRSGGVLDREDCQKISSEATSNAKATKLVDLLCEGREGKDGKAPFDVLVDALKREGVHASLASKLLSALAKAKEEEDEIRTVEPTQATT